MALTRFVIFRTIISENEGYRAFVCMGRTKFKSENIVIPPVSKAIHSERWIFDAHGMNRST